MRRTLHWVLAHWNWDDTWGWDYPMTAMCAARLGEPQTAVDVLLLDTPKNSYRANGHNHQRAGLKGEEAGTAGKGGTQRGSLRRRFALSGQCA